MGRVKSADSSKPSDELQFMKDGENKLRKMEGQVTKYIFVFGDVDGPKNQMKTYELIKKILPTRANGNRTNTREISFYKSGHLDEKLKHYNLLAFIEGESFKRRERGLYIQSPFNDKDGDELRYYFLGDPTETKTREKVNLQSAYETEMKKEFIELLKRILIKDGRYKTFEYKFLTIDEEVNQKAADLAGSAEGKNLEMVIETFSSESLTRSSVSTMKQDNGPSWSGCETNEKFKLLLTPRERKFLALHPELNPVSFSFSRQGNSSAVDFHGEDFLRLGISGGASWLAKIKASVSKRKEEHKLQTVVWRFSSYSKKECEASHERCWPNEQIQFPGFNDVFSGFMKHASEKSGKKMNLCNMLLMGPKASGKSSTIYSIERALRGEICVNENHANRFEPPGIRIRPPESGQVLNLSKHDGTRAEGIVQVIAHRSGGNYLVLEDTEGLQADDGFSEKVSKLAGRGRKSLRANFTDEENVELRESHKVLPNILLYVFNGETAWKYYLTEKSEDGELRDEDTLDDEDMYAFAKEIEQAADFMNESRNIIRDSLPIMIVFTRRDKISAGDSEVEQFTKFFKTELKGLGFEKNFDVCCIQNLVHKEEFKVEKVESVTQTKKTCVQYVQKTREHYEKIATLATRVVAHAQDGFVPDQDSPGKVMMIGKAFYAMMFDR
mmetsp:Transcript_7669/g.8797  ORF Transcript_7669/g.8797 Transcript_7669/m.8797 type:complete len:669 (+) Transcript_7669:127-2133(+)|eukprot:CAMPEP_0184051082 /NCGR_PEP_ID=MMETSP0956-20121227/4451_1 /TAXON_ID=627963 /ORGANISM="Aplanochytrium sp, Strain PBS07" /LENGTH=668 /DNA_ID=CAMNT_0026343811 /DNA_START=36 /DNA_END=2042 /DNA_ORIENTATION=-